MASVFKRTRKRPIPANAEIITYRGKPYAKWINRKTGRTQRAPLNEDGDKMLVEDDCYSVAYFDHAGKRQRVSSRTPDKDAALQLANHLETQAMKRRTGQIDPAHERLVKETGRPIAEHLADFRAYLAAKDNTDGHVKDTCRYVKLIIERCEAEGIRELTGAKVMNAVGDIRAGGVGARTANAYLQAVKSFTRWLWRERRTADDALAALSKYNEETDRRHIRRELTPEEMAYLLAFVQGYTHRNHAMPGPERAMLYRVALGTGFRRRELRSLTPASFDLDADPPTVTAAAGYSKRRRRDVQPIRRDLAELLRPWLADRPRDAQLFAKMPQHTAQMMQSDLTHARRQWISEATTDADREARERSDFLQWQDADGRVVDFHAQRHTYISGIVAGGASVKTAQTLARHSDPRLTIGRYSHARLHDLQGALDALPSTTPTETDAQPQAMAATGTDDQTADSMGAQLGHQLNGKTCENRPDTASGGETPKDGRDDRTPETAETQPVTLSLFGHKKTTAASGGESGGQGTRTLNPTRGRLISNQVPNQFGYPPELAVSLSMLSPSGLSGQVGQSCF